MRRNKKPEVKRVLYDWKLLFSILISVVLMSLFLAAAMPFPVYAASHATPSQLEEEEEDFEAWQASLEDPGLYNQVVITNRLLGIIVALQIVMMIFGLMKFIVQLIRDNITNYF